MTTSVEREVPDRSVMAEFAVVAGNFALGRTLREYPDLTVRMDRVVPLGESVVPYLWVENESVPRVVGAVEENSGVEDVSVVDEVADRALVRMDWAADGDGLVASIGAVDARVMEAVGSGDEWSLQLRFPSNRVLEDFHEECADRGVALDLLNVLGRPVGGDEALRFALTDLQRETILAALDVGYFSVPREATLEDLAEEMGVSDTAVSQRLRRGLSTLLGTALATDRAVELEDELSSGE